MKRFISLSGGVESTTLCLLYGKGATALFSDTGNEETEMYERLDFLEDAFNIIHDGDFSILRIKPKVFVKERTVYNLKDYALQSGFFASPQARWCTRKFKVEPIDDFIIEQGECELMIGLNADEEPGADRTGNLMKCDNVNYTYPLFENSISRDDCIALLNQNGLHPNFPVYMQRGGCRLCFYRGKKHAKAKYIFNKQSFLEDQQFEIALNEIGTRQLTKAGRKKFYGLNSSFTYQQIINECDAEIALWGIDKVKEMYSNVPEHKTCGVFCHR